ncbi:MAG: hypothetical protein Q4Q07_10450, partial [Tissierellia bacterium]|nr:hypothetical protein [Tissierellia bacterium]
VRLRKDEELLEDLLQGLKERIKKFVETEEYYSYIKELFLKMVDELEDGKYRLEVLEKDELWWRDILHQGTWNKKFQLDTLKSFRLGGFLLSDSKESFQVDYTLLGILEDHRYDIGKLLHHTLRGEALE